MKPSLVQADLDVCIEWNKTYGSKSQVGGGDGMGMGDDNNKEDESYKEGVEYDIMLATAWTNSL
eukprot:12786678-Ditylum_brightwellii.AAC.1